MIVELLRGLSLDQKQIEANTRFYAHYRHRSLVLLGLVLGADTTTRLRIEPRPADQGALRYYELAHRRVTEAQSITRRASEHCDEFGGPVSEFYRAELYMMELSSDPTFYQHRKSLVDLIQAAVGRSSLEVSQPLDVNNILGLQSKRTEKEEEQDRALLKRLRALLQDSRESLQRARVEMLRLRKSNWWTGWYLERCMKLSELELFFELPIKGRWGAYALDLRPRGTVPYPVTWVYDAIRITRQDAYQLALILESFRQSYDLLRLWPTFNGKFKARDMTAFNELRKLNNVAPTRRIPRRLQILTQALHEGNRSLLRTMDLMNAGEAKDFVKSIQSRLVDSLC